MKTDRRPLSDAAAVAAAAWLGGAVWRGFFFGDDALASLRTALNVAARGVASFNPTERVLTFDHPLWLGLESAIVGLPGGSYAPALRAASAAAVAAAAFVTVRRASGPKAWLLALGLPFLPLFREGMSCGLEGPLVALLLSLAAARLSDERIRGREGSPRRILLLGGLAPLAQFWAGMLLLPVALKRIFDGPPDRRFGRAALAALPLFAWAGFSLIYYRGLLPHGLHGETGRWQGLGALMRTGIIGSLDLIVREPLGASLIGCAAAKAIYGPFRPASGDFTDWLGGGLLAGAAVAFVEGGAGWSADRLALLAWLAFLVLAYDRRIPTGLFALLLASAVLFCDDTGVAGLKRVEANPAWPSRRAWSAAKAPSAGPRTIILAAEPGRTGLERGPGAYVLDRFSLSDPFWNRLNRRARATLGRAPGPASPIGTWLPDGIAGGPLRDAIALDLRLREQPAGFSEPILSVGESGDGDVYLVQYLGNRRIRLGVYKVARNAILYSTMVPDVDFARAHRVEIQYGLAPGPVSRAPRTSLAWDGRLVRRMPGLFGVRRYEPWEAAVGWNTLAAPDCTVASFTGAILGAAAVDGAGVARLPPARANRPIADSVTTLRLTIPANAWPPMPLLTTGREVESDALIVRRAGSGAVQFGYDRGDAIEWGRPTALDFARPHEISILALRKGFMPGFEDGFAAVSLDGRVVFATAREFRSYRPDDVYLLENPLQMRSCDLAFGGQISGIASRPLLSGGSSSLRDELKGLRVGRGPLTLAVLFGRAPFGAGQALVETGRTGRGDIVYVVRDDAAHIHFGFDHWGVGGAVGPRLEVDLARPHEIRIKTPWFVSPAGRTETVTLDGRTALTAGFPCYSAPADELYIAADRLRASTVAMPFQGIVIQAWRP